MYVSVLQNLTSEFAQSSKSSIDVALASAKRQSTALQFLQQQLKKVHSLTLTSCILV
jgi:hypothetical protein